MNIACRSWQLVEQREDRAMRAKPVRTVREAHVLAPIVLPRRELEPVKNTIGELIRNAVVSAKLDLAQLGLWAKIDADRLRQVVDGKTRLTAAEVDSCARVFGLRTQDFLSGKAGSAPMTLLLRADDGFDVRSVLTTEIDVALGEFQRVVRDIDELKVAMGQVAPTLPKIKRTPLPPGVHEGDHIATLVRANLGLGDERIESMVGLVERLGITVVWVTSEQVHQSLDGACTHSPRAAILVNLHAEAAYPWRARMTLAH